MAGSDSDEDWDSDFGIESTNINLSLQRKLTIGKLSKKEKNAINQALQNNNNNNNNQSNNNNNVTPTQSPLRSPLASTNNNNNNNQNNLKKYSEDADDEDDDDDWSKSPSTSPSKGILANRKDESDSEDWDADFGGGVGSSSASGMNSPLPQMKILGIKADPNQKTEWDDDFLFDSSESENKSILTPTTNLLSRARPVSTIEKEKEGKLANTIYDLIQLLAFGNEVELTEKPIIESKQPPLNGIKLTSLTENELKKKIEAQDKLITTISNANGVVDKLDLSKRHYEMGLLYVSSQQTINASDHFTAANKILQEYKDDSLSFEEDNNQYEMELLYQLGMTSKAMANIFSTIEKLKRALEISTSDRAFQAMNQKINFDLGMCMQTSETPIYATKYFENYLRSVIYKHCPTAPGHTHSKECLKTIKDWHAVGSGCLQMAKTIKIIGQDMDLCGQFARKAYHASKLSNDRLLENEASLLINEIVRQTVNGGFAKPLPKLNNSLSNNSLMSSTTTTTTTATATSGILSSNKLNPNIKTTTTATTTTTAKNQVTSSKDEDTNKDFESDEEDWDAELGLDVEEERPILQLAGTAPTVANKDRMPAHYKLIETVNNQNFEIVKYPKPSYLYSLTTPEGHNFLHEEALSKWLSSLIIKHLEGQDRAIRVLPQRASLEELRNEFAQEAAKFKKNTKKWARMNLEFCYTLHIFGHDEQCWDTIHEFFSDLRDSGAASPLSSSRGKIPTPSMGGRNRMSMELDEKDATYHYALQMLYLASKLWKQDEDATFKHMYQGLKNISVTNSHHVDIIVAEAYSHHLHHKSPINDDSDNDDSDDSSGDEEPELRTRPDEFTSNEEEKINPLNVYLRSYQQCKLKLNNLSLEKPSSNQQQPPPQQPQQYKQINSQKEYYEVGLKNAMVRALVDVHLHLNGISPLTTKRLGEPLMDVNVNSNMTEFLDAAFRTKVLTELYLEIPPTHLKAKAAYVLALQATDAGDLALAEKFYFECLYIIDKMKQPFVGIPCVLGELAANASLGYASVLLDNYKYQYAIVSFDNALLIYNIRKKKEYGTMLRRVAALARENDDINAAIYYYKQILNNYLEDDPQSKTNEIIYICEVISSLYWEKGNYKQSEEYLKVVFMILHKSNSPLSESVVHRDAPKFDNPIFFQLHMKLANLYLESYRFEKGLELLVTMRKSTLPHGKLNSLLFLLAKAYTKMEWFEECSNVLNQLENEDSLYSSTGSSGSGGGGSGFGIGSGSTGIGGFGSSLGVGNSGGSGIGGGMGGSGGMGMGGSSGLGGSNLTNMGRIPGGGSNLNVLSAGRSPGPPSSMKSSIHQGGSGSGKTERNLKYWELNCLNYYHANKFPEALICVECAIETCPISNMNSRGQYFYIRGKIFQKLVSFSNATLIIFPTTLKPTSEEWKEFNDITPVTNYTCTGDFIQEGIASFKRAYNYFKSIGDDIKIQKTVSRIAETYLDRVFGPVALLHYPFDNVARLPHFAPSKFIQKDGEQQQDEKKKNNKNGGGSGGRKKVETPTITSELKEFYITFELIENPATLAMDVNIDTCNIVQLLRTYMNMAELKFLQGDRDLAISYWTESRNLYYSLFFDGPLLIGKSAPLQFMKKVYAICKRMIRFLFAFDQDFINKNLMLVDTYLSLELEISQAKKRHIEFNKPLSYESNPQIGKIYVPYFKSYTVGRNFKKSGRMEISMDFANGLGGGNVAGNRQSLGGSTVKVSNASFHEKTKDEEKSVSTGDEVGEKIWGTFHTIKNEIRKYQIGKINQEELATRNKVTIKHIFKILTSYKSHALTSTSTATPMGGVSPSLQSSNSLAQLFRSQTKLNLSNLANGSGAGGEGRNRTPSNAGVGSSIGTVRNLSTRYEELSFNSSPSKINASLQKLVYSLQVDNYLIHYVPTSGRKRFNRIGGIEELTPLTPPTGLLYIKLYLLSNANEHVSFIVSSLITLEKILFFLCNKPYWTTGNEDGSKKKSSFFGSFSRSANNSFKSTPKFMEKTVNFHNELIAFLNSTVGIPVTDEEHTGDSPPQERAADHHHPNQHGSTTPVTSGIHHSHISTHPNLPTLNVTKAPGGDSHPQQQQSRAEDHGRSMSVGSGPRKVYSHQQLSLLSMAKKMVKSDDPAYSKAFVSIDHLSVQVCKIFSHREMRECSETNPLQLFLFVNSSDERKSSLNSLENAGQGLGSHPSSPGSPGFGGVSGTEKTNDQAITFSPEILSSFIPLLTLSTTKDPQEESAERSKVVSELRHTTFSSLFEILPTETRDSRNARPTTQQKKVSKSTFGFFGGGTAKSDIKEIPTTNISTTPLILICSKSLQVFPWELIIPDFVVRYLTLYDVMKTSYIDESNQDQEPDTRSIPTFISFCNSSIDKAHYLDNIKKDNTYKSILYNLYTTACVSPVRLLNENQPYLSPFVKLGVKPNPAKKKYKYLDFFDLATNRVSSIAKYLEDFQESIHFPILLFTYNDIVDLSQTPLFVLRNKPLCNALFIPHSRQKDVMNRIFKIYDAQLKTSIKTSSQPLTLKERYQFFISSIHAVKEEFNVPIALFNPTFFVNNN